MIVTYLGAGQEAVLVFALEDHKVQPPLRPGQIAGQQDQLAVPEKGPVTALHVIGGYAHFSQPGVDVADGQPVSPGLRIEHQLEDVAVDLCVDVLRIEDIGDVDLPRVEGVGGGYVGLLDVRGEVEVGGDQHVAVVVLGEEPAEVDVAGDRGRKAGDRRLLVGLIEHGDGGADFRVRLQVLEEDRFAVEASFAVDLQLFRHELRSGVVGQDQVAVDVVEVHQDPSQLGLIAAILQIGVVHRKFPDAPGPGLVGVLEGDGEPGGDLDGASDFGECDGAVEAPLGEVGPQSQGGREVEVEDWKLSLVHLVFWVWWSTYQKSAEF